MICEPLGASVGVEPGADLVARAISVVLTDGRVIDTIVHGLAAPLNGMPGTAAAVLMIPIQALMHIPVPSVSGQAVLTMPIMAPLADLLGVSRDAAVIALPGISSSRYSTVSILSASPCVSSDCWLTALRPSRRSWPVRSAPSCPNRCCWSWQGGT